MKINTWSPEGNKVCVTAELTRYMEMEGATLWVDMTSNEEEGANILQDKFHFHPLAIEDTRNQRQRPKVEEYNNYLFVILNTMSVKDDEVTFHEIDAFMGRNYIVTVHAQNDPIITEMQRRLERGSSVNGLMSAGFLLYVLLDTIVDSYFPAMDQIGETIEELEEATLRRPEKKLLDRLFWMRRMLAEIWRVVNNHRNMFGVLMHHNEVFTKNEVLQYYLRDVYDHLVMLSDTVNTYRDLMTGLVELYMSAVSNRLNIVVTRLTVYTLIIGAMTVIGGFYGMNFEHTWPPFDAIWGVPFVIALMIIVTGVMLFIFRLIDEKNY